MSDFTYSDDGWPLGGWSFDRERLDELEAASSPFEMAMLGDVSDLPEEFDLHPNQPMEHQGQEGSCQGQSMSSCIEVCRFMDDGTHLQLSRDCAYYWSQEFDGIRGDRGSTLAGGRKVATQRGLPPESMWPYSDRYNPRPPVSKDNLLKAAEPNRVKRTTILRSVEDVVNWMATGQGPVQLGIRWGVKLNSDGVVTRWSPSGGGHAVYLRGRTKKFGKPASILANSWGKRWGDRGYAYLPDDILIRMLRDRYSVFQGFSGMAQPRRRFIKFTKENVTWV